MITFAPGLFLITILALIDGSHQATCDENEFACGNGECLDSFLVCDGEANCKDGSDETKAVCSKTHVVCQPFAFRCAYGACIDGNKKCDGKQNCADNSDERHPDCKASKPPASTSSCPGSFQCDSGQCIGEYLVCDGEANCRDGSDETLSRCINFPCPDIVGFQCSYGGCIDKERQCNGVKDCIDGSDEDPALCNPSSSRPTTPPDTRPPTDTTPNLQNGCLLPRQPDGGIFLVANCTHDDVSDKCRRISGTLVSEYTALSYSCAEGFNLSDTSNSVRYCINSVWYPVTPVTCLELCRALKSNSLDITCTNLGRPVNCLESVLPDTKARLKCKQSYRLQSVSGSDEIICGPNGRWSEPLFHCIPECGIKTVNSAVPLISYGENTSAVEYPWHSGLYKLDKRLGDFELFCGGSIITPYMIISAAHCFFEEKRRISEKAVKVAVGKTIRSWGITETSEQRFNVSNIFVHNDYRGDDNYYAFDIALLELDRHIIIGSQAMPVCMEWFPPWTQIPNGTPGTVVGWGKNENEQLTESLMVVVLPFLDQPTCKARAPDIFKKFITHEKFCATYKAGAGVQQGDSGGGLVFLKPENKLYYIHGLVSTKPKNENTYATFTNVTAETDIAFIKKIRNMLMVRHQ